MRSGGPSSGEPARTARAHVGALRGGEGRRGEQERDRRVYGKRAYAYRGRRFAARANVVGVAGLAFFVDFADFLDVAAFTRAGAVAAFVGPACLSALRVSSRFAGTAVGENCRDFRFDAANCATCSTRCVRVSARTAWLIQWR
jgi:hypothetical protein